MKMINKTFVVLILLVLIGFISGCETQDTPTTTTLDSDLDDITGELNDIDTVTGSDYSLDDINLEQDMPDI